MNKITFFIIAITCCANISAQRRVQRQIAKLPTVTTEYARELIKEYKFDEAITALQTIIDYNQKKKLPSLDEEALMTIAIKGNNMLEATEKIIVIDSIVIDKNDFLSAYNFSTETGTLQKFNNFFNRIDETKNKCIVYRNELSNKIVFSDINDDGQMCLYISNTGENGWSKPNPIIGLEENIDSNYPFLMSDGLTLYFSSKGENSLGGYDIFVTREGNEEGRFLKPENIGMPFNSTANDYMLVIDDFSQLGWFASDRNQPENKVCIYVFIPNESRVTYDISESNIEHIRQNAMLNSIRTTWNEENEMRKAKQRYVMLTNQSKTKTIQKDFEFVIDDLTTYYTLSNFKCDEARKAMQQLIQLKKDYKNLSTDLEKERNRYGNNTNNLNIKNRIVILEQQCEQLLQSNKSLEKSIRNIEINYLKK